MARRRPRATDLDEGGQANQAHDADADGVSPSGSAHQSHLHVDISQSQPVISLSAKRSLQPKTSLSSSAMQLVDNSTFLTQLTALLESAKDHGSIWLTHKRLTHDGEDAAMKHEESGFDEHEYQCLIRATNGKNINFSTHISPDELPSFYTHYGTLLKSSLSLTLRKRDRKKEKSRQEQSFKRKKRMTESIVVVDGPKRGNGRRKRQRKVRALEKQGESQRKYKEREEEAEKRRREEGRPQ